MSFFKKMMLIVSLFVVSGVSNAATYNLDLINETSDNQLTSFGSSGLFTDYFNFSLAQDSVVSVDLFFTSGLQGLALTVHLDSDESLVWSAGSGFSSGLQTDSLALTTGNYYAQLSGDVFGSGTYDLEISRAVTPVPEASTIAMMLGGLGLVGFMARRRKSI